MTSLVIIISWKLPRTQGNICKRDIKKNYERNDDMGRYKISSEITSFILFQERKPELTHKRQKLLVDKLL